MFLQSWDNPSPAGITLDNAEQLNAEQLEDNVDLLEPHNTGGFR
jgi:hypothetical protein